MAKLVTYMFVLSLLCTTTLASSGKIAFSVQVYRLGDGFNSETSLEKPIVRLLETRCGATKSDVTVFDSGTFCWNKHAKLVLKPDHIKWNTKALDANEVTHLPADKVKLIYSPEFVKNINELARLKIEGKRPFQYMRQRDDGLYELVELPLPVGMDLEIKAVKRNDKEYLISYLELELRTVGKREPVPGVNLAIGKPILKEWEYVMSMDVDAKKSYNILLKPDGISGAVIVRIEVDGA